MRYVYLVNMYFGTRVPHNTGTDNFTDSVLVFTVFRLGLREDL